MLMTAPAYDHVRGWHFKDVMGRRMKGGCSCASSLGFDPLTRQYHQNAIGDYIPQSAWQSYCGVPGAWRRRSWAAASGEESEAVAVAVAVTKATRAKRDERMILEGGFSELGGRVWESKSM